MANQKVLTEQTSKKYKAPQLFGCLGMGLSLILVLIGVAMTKQGGSGFLTVIGSLLLLASLGTIIVARMLAWWHHG